MPAAIPTTMRYVVAREPGPPDVLVLDQTATPAPKSGEVLIEVSYAGVNRPDCIQRAGHYPPPASHNIRRNHRRGSVRKLGRRQPTRLFLRREPGRFRQLPGR